MRITFTHNVMIGDIRLMHVIADGITGGNFQLRIKRTVAVAKYLLAMPAVGLQKEPSQRGVAPEWIPVRPLPGTSIREISPGEQLRHRQTRFAASLSPVRFNSATVCSSAGISLVGTPKSQFVSGGESNVAAVPYRASKMTNPGLATRTAPVPFFLTLETEFGTFSSRSHPVGSGNKPSGTLNSLDQLSR